jgi:hypothetical protein
MHRSESHVLHDILGGDDFLQGYMEMYCMHACMRNQECGEVEWRKWAPWFLNGDVYAKAPTIDIPAAPSITYTSAQMRVFLFIKAIPSSERKSSARRSTVAA